VLLHAGLQGVSLSGKPYQEMANKRESWALQDLYLNPGSTQFAGASATIPSYTLTQEQ
jgi:hypothetical protein